jgi:predicted AAA+ superfamily ATPase
VLRIRAQRVGEGKIRSVEPNKFEAYIDEDARYRYCYGMTYSSRIIDAQIKEYLDGLAAIAIVGAKGVGKTSTAKRNANTVLELDVSEAARAFASSRESMASLKDTPVLIDEWSRAPQSWDVVRRLVDDDRAPGHFILTGSASQTDANIHSGAGRIVQLKMRPLSIQERIGFQAKVRLSDLLDESLDVNLYESCQATMPDYAEEICLSGFPGIHELSQRFARVQLDGYIEDIIQKEFPEQGLKVRKPHVLKAWLKAYAAATASTTSYKKILVASTAGEDQKPASSTTLVYRDVLDMLYLTDRVDPWLPTDNHFTTLGKSPKHYLVDPGLAARILGLDVDGLIKDAIEPLGPQRKTSIFGRLFESLAASSLKVYCQHNEADLFHLRTPMGDHEVDFIVIQGNTVIGIEVKLSHEVSQADVSQLHWLQTKLASHKKLIKVVINTGAYAYRREDGVFVVPLGILGA